MTNVNIRPALVIEPEAPMLAHSPTTVTAASRSSFWLFATATAVAALLFPKIEGIRNHGRSAWQLLIFFVPLDIEGLILIPLVVAVTFALFWLVGGWAIRDTGGRNRPARVGLVCGLLGLVGVAAFWLSLPIILGGLAIMLGLQARRLAKTEGRRGEAIVALVTGICAVTVGAIMWSFIT